MTDQSQPPPRAECDRLHETGCILCGAASSLYELGSNRKNLRARFCCKHGDYSSATFAAVDAEITRRRSLQSAQKWEPRKGELCEGTIVEWATASMSRGQLVQGVYDGTSGGNAVLIVNGSRRSITPSSLKPLQPTPPAKHEWQPGMRVTWDERENPCGAKFGVVDPVGSINRLYASIYGDGAYVSLDKPNADNIREWWVPLNILRPAASAQPESWHGFEKGERVRHKLEKWTGVVSGGYGGNQVEVIRDDGQRFDGKNGAYQACCDNLELVTEAESKPSPQPRRDPYAEHRKNAPAWLCDNFGPEDSQLDKLIAATRAERLRAQHLADLDRPIRTGACLTRDKYGQLLSLKGWPEDSEYKEQV